MSMLLVIYCMAAAALVVGLVAAIVFRRLYLRRRARHDREMGRLYLRIVIHALMTEEGDEPFFPRLYSFGGRLVLAETLAHLTSTTYGLDPAPLRRIVETAELESYLLRRARWAWGYRRARFLSLLACLPPGEQSVGLAARFDRDRSRSVRFYALLVRLATEPSQALRHVAEHADSFSAFELAEIMAMLRRGVFKLAYEPLVRASERNLRSLGLYIVRHFAIEEAEPVLLEMVATEQTQELGCEALYTLCALRCPLEASEVASRVAMMNFAERKALLRYMAFEGYAEGTVNKLFSREEMPYFDALIHSYKRPLVCI